LGLAAGADAARHREGDVDDRADIEHPGHVEAAILGARADVVEDQLVAALVTVAQGMLQYVAGVAMVAELDALDDAAVAHVEAGYDPSRRHRSLPRGRGGLPRSPCRRWRPPRPAPRARRDTAP